jgi:hypothetical protein
MKSTSTKALLLAILILAGMIVSPVCAYYMPMGVEPADGGLCLNFIDGVCVDNTNITQHKIDGITSLSYAEAGRVLSVINIYQGVDTTVNFTLHYGNASTETGYIVYSNIVPLLYSKQEISLGGYYNSQEFMGQPSQNRYIIGYASEMADNGTLISKGFMLQNGGLNGPNLLVFYPVSDFAGNLITSIDITSTKPIDVLILTDNVENTVKLADFTGKNQLDTLSEWVQLAGQFSGFAIGFIWGIFWVIKFFFIDNLLLIIALWISVSMAYSAITSPNIWGFYKKFFRTQKALVDFIISLWMTLWSIINYLVQIFVKWL